MALVVTRSAYTQELKKGLMPVTPYFLLRALPEEVNGWELKRSDARLGVGIWMESEACREFVREVKGKDGEKGESLYTKITIKDTAKFKGSELDLFQDFTPAKYPDEGYEYLYLAGNPVIIADYKTKGLEAQFLVHKRFIVTFTLRGQHSRNLKKWFDQVNVSALKTTSDGSMVYLPDDFTVIEIDELNSSKSRRYKSSKAEAEAEASNEENEDPISE